MMDILDGDSPRAATMGRAQLKHSSDVVWPEGLGEQVAQREGLAESVGAAHEDRRGVGSELPDLLPASAAGGAQMLTAAGHGYLHDAALGGPVNRCVNESGSVPLLMLVDSNSVSVFGSLPHIVK